jgi:hypothetical protein
VTSGLVLKVAKQGLHAKRVHRVVLSGLPRGAEDRELQGWPSSRLRIGWPLASCGVPTMAAA